MIRRIAYAKAIVAGVLGAAGWELAARALLHFGVVMPDIVYVLGTLIVGAHSLLWWPAGFAAHCMVGALWAIFYAYFFWDEFQLAPPLQGLLFSIGPTLLAGLILIPEFDVMHPMILNGQMNPLGMFAHRLGLMGPAGVFAGHVVYGLILGSVYTHPVGYRIPARTAHA